MDFYLKDGERLDDLEYKGMKVIQGVDGYCFTSDAVMLANFVKAGGRERAVELGTGSGVISILVAAKTNVREIIGVEIQPRLADSARRSVVLNGLSERIKIEEGDVTDAVEKLGRGSFDLAFTNPPYYKDNGGRSERDIARSEVLGTLESFVKSAGELLKFGGRFYAVIKTERLADAVYFMKLYGIEPKVMRFILPKQGKAPDVFLIEGKKGGKSGIRVLPALVMWEKDGEMSEEAKEVYGK